MKNHKKLITLSILLLILISLIAVYNIKNTLSQNQKASFTK
ncbi:hypothetical protein B0H35_002393 [Clostridium acetobutylicum]|nr:hypothetical protein [Clostridium acetobutylicum]NOW14878.1 hypothetical protein [Clostridium acetobutylicum]